MEKERLCLSARGNELPPSPPPLRLTARPPARSPVWIRLRGLGSIWLALSQGTRGCQEKELTGEKVLLQCNQHILLVCDLVYRRRCLAPFLQFIHPDTLISPEASAFHGWKGILLLGCVLHIILFSLFSSCYSVTRSCSTKEVLEGFKQGNSCGCHLVYL